MRLLDLSHAIEHQMITYPGLPGPEIGEHLSFDASTAQLQPRYRVRDRFDQHSRQHRHLPGHPAHRFPDGHDLAYLPLKRCVLLPAVVVDAERVIGPAESTEVDVDGSAVLLRTGWDQHWGTSRYGDPAHPHLTDAGARVLADRGAVLVGIDSVNIDDTSTGQRPAHTILLAAGIPIVEHLTGLAALSATGARITAVPPAVRGLAAFPVRAFASVL